MGKVRTAFGVIFLVVGLILFLLGIWGLFIMLQVGGQGPGYALAFLIAWWIPIVIFGIPGVILMFFGYKLIGKKEEVKKEVVYVHQSATKTCPRCGKQVPADAKLCPYCGYKF